VQYINYTRNLEFEQEPDYVYLKGLFKKVMLKSGYIHDYNFDWVKNANAPSNKNSIKIQNNTLKEENDTKVFKPNYGNTLINPHKYIESIQVNNQTTQLMIEDKAKNFQKNKYSHSNLIENRGNN